MKKVLITGTAGFIGHHLATRLAKEGYQVVGLDSINAYYDVSVKYGRLERQGIEVSRIKPGELLQGSGNISFIQLALEDKSGIDALFASERFDYVVNLAAQAGVRYSLTNPEVYISSNITGFLNILEACRHFPVEHLVYASSSSVYGLNAETPFTEDQHTDHPISLYAASKKSNELMAHTYAHLFGVKSTGLRFFTVYGPWGRPDMALFIFTKAILEGRPIQVFNNGQMIRDFTYVDDIVEAITRLVPTPAKGIEGYDFTKQTPAASSAPYRIYNIGNNAPVNLMDFIHLIEKEIGREATFEYLPMQPGDVGKTYADCSKLYDTISFKPATSAATGIKNFVGWYREFFNV